MLRKFYRFILAYESALVNILLPIWSDFFETVLVFDSSLYQTRLAKIVGLP